MSADLPTPHRDRVLDLVRVLAMMLVVGQHWLITVLAVDGGAIVLDRTLVLSNAWPLTWVTQVMPLVFFTAGAATAMSLRGGRGADPGWVSRRLVRLVGPVVVLAAVWLPLTPLLAAAGLDPALVSTGGRLVGALLWFLVVLVLLTLLTPVLLRLADRFRGREIAVLALGAVIVDVVRFGLGLELVGYLNAVLVWAAVYAVGIHHARGRLRRLRGRRALVLGAAGLALLVLAVAVGPYPTAMIGLPGTTVSNMNPPSAALLALATAQIGMLLAARGPLARFVGRRRIGRLLEAASPHVMSVYLWHTPAIVVVAAAAVALSLRAPAVGSPLWWWSLLAWSLTASAVLAVLVRLLGPWGQRVTTSAVGRGRALLGGFLVAIGLLVLTIGGFDPARLSAVVGPLLGTWALVGGALLLGGRPAGVSPVPAGMVGA